jgi:hypothetical protein
VERLSPLLSGEESRDQLLNTDPDVQPPLSMTGGAEPLSTSVNQHCRRGGSECNERV